MTVGKHNTSFAKMPYPSYMRRRYGGYRRRYPKYGRRGYNAPTPYGTRVSSVNRAIRATLLPELKQYQTSIGPSAVNNLASTPIYLDLDTLPQGPGIAAIEAHRIYCEGFRIRYTVATGTSNNTEDLCIRVCVIENKVSPSSTAYQTGSNVFQGNSGTYSTGGGSTSDYDHINPWARDAYTVKYDKVNTVSRGANSTGSPGTITRSIWIPVKKQMHYTGSNNKPVNTQHFLWFIARVGSGDGAEDFAGTVLATNTMFYREV